MPWLSKLRGIAIFLLAIGAAGIGYGVLEAIDIAGCVDGGTVSAVMTCPTESFENVYGPIIIGSIAETLGVLLLLGIRMVPGVGTAEARAAGQNGLETLARYRSSADGISSDGIRSKAAEVAATQGRTVWEQANKAGRPGGAAAAKKLEGWDTDPENMDPLSGRN